MPELPEVETICRQLNEVLVGKKIQTIEVLREKSFKGNPGKLAGWEVERVGRKSKVVEIYFKKMDEMVIIHLKMTGQLVFEESDTVPQCHKKRVAGGHPTADWVKELPSKHTRVVMDFTDGSKLFFNDMRVFGWMRIITKTQELKNSRTQIPDIVDGGFTLEYFEDVLNKSKRAIKIVIMDQGKMGGVGNIYANDALYLAKVRPDRKANSLSAKETNNLWVAVKEVIRRGIKYGGASMDNYFDIWGMGGNYQGHFLVYQRTGEKCNKCGMKIKKMKIGGRGTFYCPKCQK